MKLISVHAPKAGGTSIGRSLQKAFGSGYRGENSDDPASPLSERNLHPARYFSRNRILPLEVNCIHGHFHPGQFNVEEKTFLFTMLRHPVSNIISIYTFWKTLESQGQPLHDYFLREQLDIIETARLPLLRWLYSQTYFGGFDMGRFDMIGRHEDRGTDLLRLGTLLGLTIDGNEYSNSTPLSHERDELLADHALLRRLHIILADDIRFYESCCV